MRIDIATFQKLYQISMYNANEIEKASLLVQCLTGKSEHEINRMNIKKFNKLCNNINENFELLNKKMNENKPKQIVKANGRYYWLNYDLSKKPNNAAKYVEVATFSDNIIVNLHKIMATMATPLKLSWKGMVKVEREHEDIANDMLHLDFNVAYHAAVFFWAVFTKSINLSHSYLIGLMSDTDKAEGEQLLKTFQDYSDGFITPK